MSIIGSLLNNDWYKFTMPPVVRKHYRDVVVGVGFTNRNTDFPVADYVDLAELADELTALRELRFTQGELDFLRGLGVIDPEYIDSLASFRMPEVYLERRGSQIRMEAEGLWHAVMPVEVPALQIVTELVSRRLADHAGLTPRDIRTVGYQRLDQWVELFQSNPHKKFAPFGTRRHFSTWWEYEATAYLVDKIPENIAGISNVGLAREFGYPLSGTIAHEYFMVPTMAAIALKFTNPIGYAQNEAMDFWEAEYADVWNGGMLCAIPDTFGTDTFLRYFERERAEKWLTFKQDSGDPPVFVEKVVARLRELDVDPANYRINHTDGLNVAKTAKLMAYADTHTAHYLDGYGIGTMISNNVGVLTHSFVWKPIWVMVGSAKVPAVKLGDNLKKATGNPAMVAEVKRLCGYTNTFSELQNV
jgi:nicotinate phosphoribosyltransferase